VRGSRAGPPWVETPRSWAGNPPIRLPNELPGRASLDGEPPASTIVAERSRACRWLSPTATWARRRAVLVGSRSSTPPRYAPRCGRYSRPAELAIPSLTSSVMAFRGPSIAARSPSLPATEARFLRRLVKDDALHEPGRLPSSECSLPLSYRTLARLRVGSRGARHRSRCSRAGGFRHRDPASDASSHARRERLSASASELDPRSFDLGPSAARRLLQPPQSQSTTTAIARFPPAFGRARPACACALHRRCPPLFFRQCGAVCFLRRIRDPTHRAAAPAEVSRVRSWPAFAGRRIPGCSFELLEVCF